MPESLHNNEPRAEDALDEDDIQGLVAQQVEEAWHWREQYVEPQQELATEYYRGEPYGDEREGRSQVRTSEVRDGILAILPSLMKVYTSSERAVEFDPIGVEDEALSQQQTDYVNHIFYNDNQGVKLLYSTLKDALTRKLGVMKWGFEEKDVVEGSEHTGLDEAGLATLQSDPYGEVENVTQREDGTFEARLIRKYSKQRVKVWAVPPEEFVWSPSATCIEDAALVAHVRDAPASELVAMGVPRDLVEEKQR